MQTIMIIQIASISRPKNVIADSFQNFRARQSGRTHLLL